MKEQMRIVRRYLTYLSDLTHKRELGYSLSQKELDMLEYLRQDALNAKKEIKQEEKYISKLLKKVK